MKGSNFGSHLSGRSNVSRSIVLIHCVTIIFMMHLSKRVIVFRLHYRFCFPVVFQKKLFKVKRKFSEKKRTKKILYQNKKIRLLEILERKKFLRLLFSADDFVSLTSASSRVNTVAHLSVCFPRN